MNQPLKPIDAADCSKFASAGTLKKSTALDKLIAKHNADVDRHADELRVVCTGDVDLSKVTEIRSRLERDHLELSAERVSLVLQRIATRAMIREEYAPHHAQREAELQEARKAAELEALKFWPRNEVENRYDERQKLVDQLTKRQVAAVRWEPACLRRDFVMLDKADCESSRAALGATFRL